MQKDSSNRGKLIQIDEGQVKEHLGEIVRGSVEETLNALLQAEADQLCNARRYERSEGRKDTRAGSYERSLETKAGKVKLKMPRLRSLPFETAIVERYRRRESSVEEALVEMYLAGVSVRRVSGRGHFVDRPRIVCGVGNEAGQITIDLIEELGNGRSVVAVTIRKDSRDDDARRIDAEMELLPAPLALALRLPTRLHQRSRARCCPR